VPEKREQSCLNKPSKAHDLKEVVAEQTLELRLLKKSMTSDGGGHE